MNSLHQHSEGLSPRTRDAAGRDRRTIDRNVRRKARDIINRLPLEGLTWNDRVCCAGMYVWERGAMTWYVLDKYSISAVCWAAYRHALRNRAAVREAVRILTKEAKTGLRPPPDWWIAELATRDQKN